MPNFTMDQLQTLKNDSFSTIMAKLLQPDFADRSS